MKTATGLDVLVESGFASLRGKRIAVLCNQASVDHSYRNILEHLVPLHRSGFLKIRAVLGPQHGLFGHTQDNMIEWEATGGPSDFNVFSLYGETRKPTPEMLMGIDRLVIDIQDVGARYYTFVWTMAYCIEACSELGIPVTILDRPNPIGGARIEGPVLEAGYESFVGLYPLATRHGMTAGEIARFVHDRIASPCPLDIVSVQGWDRSLYLDQTDAPWAMPSPNMPTVDTAVVYPGGCLLEATNLSEGRGTTRPFEIVGAPFLNGALFAEALNKLQLPGVYFRSIQFEPTFNKHVGKVCEGAFVHVLDRNLFQPVLTYTAILQESIRQTGIHEVSTDLPCDEKFIAGSAECALPGFAWRRPPYEYVYDRMPIDILAGSDWYRYAVTNLSDLSEILSSTKEEMEEFCTLRNKYVVASDAY